MILMAEHCGTHLDCPYHVDEAGPSVDQMPLERLIVPGHLLDFANWNQGVADGRHRGVLHSLDATVSAMNEALPWLLPEQPLAPAC